MIRFKDVYDFFEAVSFGEDFGVEGHICRETGKTWLCGDDCVDGDEPLPDDIDSDRYLVMPQKRDLDLGKDLVLEFVAEHLPERFDQVKGYFSKRGAYAKYKFMLEKEAKLDLWYQFENERSKKALREWCKENGLIVSE